MNLDEADGIAITYLILASILCIFIPAILIYNGIIIITSKTIINIIFIWISFSLLISIIPPYIYCITIRNKIVNREITNRKIRAK